MQKRKGFTTVELVIVIAVIAILATALIPTFGGLIKSANHNVDVQTANSLTKLIMMYDIDHKVESESDLADAINEGMNDPNYYANLKAKSAQYGYCFWYDYENKRVHVGTVEEIAEMAKTPATQTFSTDDVRLGAAGSTNTANTFGLRGGLIPGFVLMGFGGGNDLMDLVCNLEKAENVGAYANAIAAINAAVETNVAITNLKAAAKTTVIHNDGGVYVPAETPTIVHIPQGTEKLSNNFYGDLALVGVQISIPTGATVTSGSLAYLDSTSSIEINIAPEELKVKVELQSTVATIIVNTGDRYVQDTENSDKNVFIPEDPNGTSVVGDAIAALHSFVLSDNDNEYVYIDTTNKIIYVSKDLTEAFELVAGSFSDVDGNTTSHGFFSWKLGGSTEPLNNKGKTISIAPNTTSVTVKTLGVEYTYTIKEVKVESIAIAEIGGLKPWRSVSYNDDTRSWALTTQIVLTDGLTHDKLTLDKTITINNNRFTINSDAAGNATLSISSSLTGNSSNKVIFTSSGTNSVEMTITLLDCGDSAFKVNSNANTQTKYNFKYVVGTTGYAVTLGDLFVPNGVESVSADIVLSKDGESDWLSFSADKAWNTITLNELTGFTSTNGTFSLYIKEKNGQYSAPVVLDVKPGAYNVATINDWKNAPDNTSIVLINSLTGDNAIPGGDYNTNANGYSKNIGAATIYGNLKTISVPDNFKIFYGAYNYFIQAAGGTIDHLVLVGPDYGSEVSVTGSGGDAESKGTHVSGIMAAGNINIHDSFISGFRSPLNVTVSGNIVIKRTTLNRGNFANVNVEKASTFDLENVTTIQYEGKGGNIGAGFFFKYFAGANTIKATGLVQHNYVTETQIKSIAALFLNSMGKDVADALSGIFITGTDLTAMANAGIAHTDSDGSTTLYHAGMFLQSQGSTKSRFDTTPTDVVGPTLNFSEVNGGTYSSSNPIVKGIIFVKKSFGATIIGLDSDACGTACSHTRSAIPGSSPADFLASKEVK